MQGVLTRLGDWFIASEHIIPHFFPLALQLSSVFGGRVSCSTGLKSGTLGSWLEA